MPELMDAFEAVLDRMVDAERRAAEALVLNKNGDQQVSLLQRDLNNARSELTSAKQRLREFESGEEAFTDLYNAINTATAKMRIEGLTEFADGLDAKMVAAKKFIDPIPF